MATKQSLVSKSEATSLDLPDITTPSTQVVQTIIGTSYACYISSRSKAYPELVQQIPGIKEPDVVLVQSPPKKPLLLNPFKFFFIGGRQYWAVINQDGDLPQVALSQQDRPFVECIETMLLCIHESGLYPCIFTFRSTKCPAAQACSVALTEASNEDTWAARGEAYKTSLRMPKPYLRFVANVTCRNRTARGSGFTYWQAKADIQPSSPNDWVQLAKWWQSEENQKEFVAVVDRFKYRVSEIERQVKA